MSSLEQRLEDHLKEQDRIDEMQDCVVCGEAIRLHYRDGYQTVPDGVIHNSCAEDDFAAEARFAAMEFYEQVANGGDPIEAARDADASANDAEVMAFEDWRTHWQAFYGVPVPR